MSGIDPAILSDLATAYDGDVIRRNDAEIDFRKPIVDKWIGELTDGSRIIELGAGTGQVAAYIAAAGFEVLAVDLSPENVAMCRKRGLSAVVADMARVGELDTPDYQPPYDAGLAINSLIHIPKDLLGPAMGSIRATLKTGGEFLAVLWGGESSEGVWDDDWTDPPRFFAVYADDELDAWEFPGFEKISFEALEKDHSVDMHSLVVRLRAV